MERTWKKMDRDIKDGEIIRFKLSAPNPKSKDGYIYGRAMDGFGTRMDTIGNAIYVHNEAWNYEDCEKGLSKDVARWERYWGIEISDEPHDPKYTEEFFAREKAKEDREKAELQTIPVGEE